MRQFHSDVLMAKGEWARARKSYEGPLQEHTGLSDPGYRLAQLDLSGGNHKAAMVRLEKLVANWPQAAKYRLALAVFARL